MSRLIQAWASNADELLAQALEHEIDHLNGILYIDHLVSPDSLWKIPPASEEPSEDDEGDEDADEESDEEGEQDDPEASASFAAQEQSGGPRDVLLDLRACSQR